MDCVLKSFAYAINVDPQALMLKIGHDGTEIVNPEFEYPYNVRGFNVYEMGRVLFDLGYAVTHIPKNDMCHNAKMPTIKWFNEHIDRVQPYLNQPMYVLHTNTHVIGVRNGIVLDLENKCTDPRTFEYIGIFIVSKIL